MAEDSWEENDNISKLLCENEYKFGEVIEKEEGKNEEGNEDSVPEFLSKSLHAELLEVGELLHEPIRKTERSSLMAKTSMEKLRSLINEFNDINDIVERKLSQSSCRIRSNSQSLESISAERRVSQISCNTRESIQSDERTTQNNMDPHSKPAEINQSFNLQSSMNEFKSISQIVERKLNRSSFTARSSSQLDESIRQNNLQVKDWLRQSTSCKVGSESQSSIIYSKSKTVVRPPPGFNKTNWDTEKRTKNLSAIRIMEEASAVNHNKSSGQKWRAADEFLSEFHNLSTIMDKELLHYVSNVQVMDEEKQSSRHLEIKNQGKVDILKSLLYEEKYKMKNLEHEYKKKLQSTGKKYNAEIERLQQTIRDNNESSRCLQNEFNKVLNERESEIETLYAEVKLIYILVSYYYFTFTTRANISLAVYRSFSMQYSYSSSCTLTCFQSFGLGGL